MRKDGYLSQTFAAVSVSTSGANLGDVFLEQTSDTVPPTIVSLALSPEDYAGGSSVEVTLSVFDDRSAGADLAYAVAFDTLDCARASYTAVFDACATPPCTSTSSLATQGLSPGEHTVIACAKDAASLTSAPATQKIIFDASPPLAPDGLLVAAGSRRATLTWIPASDAESPIIEQRIEVAREPGFTTLAMSVALAASADQSEVRVLDNYRPYWFRVRAKNAAGLETTSAPQERVLGFEKTPVATFDGQGGEGRSALFASPRRLFVANAFVQSDNGATDPSLLQLLSCDSVDDDCADPSAWLSSNGFAFVSNGSVSIRPSFAATNQALYLAFKAIGVNPACDVRVYRCRAEDACQFAANWALVTVESYAYAGGSQCSDTNDGQLSARGDAVSLAYTKNGVPMLATCLEDSGCDSSGDWALAQTLQAADVAGSFVASDERRLFVSARKNPQTFRIGRCAVASGCNAPSDFSELELSATAPSTDGEARSPRLVLDRRALYVIYDRYRTSYNTPGGFQRTYVRRCLLASGCASDADFSAPISMFGEINTEWVKERHFGGNT